MGKVVTMVTMQTPCSCYNNLNKIMNIQISIKKKKEKLPGKCIDSLFYGSQ